MDTPKPTSISKDPLERWKEDKIEFGFTSDDEGGVSDEIGDDNEIEEEIDNIDKEIYIRNKSWGCVNSE